MPMYLIERVWDPVDEQELAKLAVQSKRLIQETFTDLSWERSQVVSDEAGVIRTFCVYSAPSIGRIKEHSAVLGCHRVENVYEIAGVIDPKDFTV